MDLGNLELELQVSTELNMPTRSLRLSSNQSILEQMFRSFSPASTHFPLRTQMVVISTSMPTLLQMVETDTRIHQTSAQAAEVYLVAIMVAPKTPTTSAELLLHPSTMAKAQVTVLTAKMVEAVLVQVAEVVMVAEVTAAREALATTTPQLII